MICDTIDNLRKYAGVDPRFNAIADFVERNDLAAIADGSMRRGQGEYFDI